MGIALPQQQLNQSAQSIGANMAMIDRSIEQADREAAELLWFIQLYLRRAGGGGTGAQEGRDSGGPRPPLIC